MSASDDADTIAAAIAAAAASPKKVTGDAGSVEQFGLAELIEAEKYARRKAAGSAANFGLRFLKIRPPGAV